MATYHSAPQASGSVSSYSENVATFGSTITLVKLNSAKERKGYWFYGEIKHVLSRNNWCYSSCPDNSCAKKVEFVGDDFLCNKWHKTTTKPLYKYSLKLSVEHDNELATVLLWDEVCQLLLGKTALELHKLPTQVEGVQDTPEEIMDLVGKGYFFKISNYGLSIGNGRTYTVNALCNDPEILAKHKPENTIVVEANVCQTIEELDEHDNTPSSKHPMDEEDDAPDNTPTTKPSTRKKLKKVKKDKL